MVGRVWLLKQRQEDKPNEDKKRQYELCTFSPITKQLQFSNRLENKSETTITNSLINLRSPVEICPATSDIGLQEQCSIQ